jgi:hypothetical protein
MKGRIEMAKNRLFSKLVGAALAGAAGLAAYTLLLRPRHLKWGATEDECREPLPGDEFLPNPENEATHAITINARVYDVWPWLVQIGQTRGGFYSYAWLENLAGCDMHNADRVVPEWQSLRVGDVVWLHPKAPPLPVIILEPYQAIVLGSAVEADKTGADAIFGSGTWGFYLKEVSENTTRLLVRSRGTGGSGPLGWFVNYAMFEPAHFIMERKMMLGIKERAEALALERAKLDETGAATSIASAST